ncbi:aminopeptidase P family protein [Paraphotobacterium marinum]|uniref:aminopeptidase P family protein n=1 Tax=Paraphotobacterium marinum TaxID=1755811 RepID=UPI0039E9BF6D
MQFTIEKKVKLIRDWLKKNNLDAIIIPHENEFLCEYVPANHERLLWATGFTGSSGFAVISENQAAIFVDGRYTVQVKQQVPNSVFDYCSIPTDTITEWLLNNLAKNSKIAIDPKVHSISWVKSTESLISDNLSFINISENPIDYFWEDKPSQANTVTRHLPESITGQSSNEKIQYISTFIKDKKLDLFIISQLESIAWILNLRGNDIPCLPVIFSHLIIDKSGMAHFFVKADLINQIKNYDFKTKITIHDVNDYARFLSSLKDLNIGVDPLTCNQWTQNQLTNNNINHVEDPTIHRKAIKNKTEIEGFKKSHLNDGIALVKFFSWLEQSISNKKILNEDTLSKKLWSFRKENKDCIEPSFDTISAAGPNAAMCHYNHLNSDNPSKLPENGLYLLDSGAQYLYGTTDVTRTIAIGKPTQKMIDAYTLVLKGHISVSKSLFPKGTSGSQIDTFARQYLWEYGLDFAHGTGHGVGHFLNVHEGPQRISKLSNVPLETGMVVSNEPGYYLENEFGIRIENLEVVVEKENKGNSISLGFSSLTKVPLDISLINKDLLNDEEINWINDYHADVYNSLEAQLSEELKSWLRIKTKPM